MSGRLQTKRFTRLTHTPELLFIDFIMNGWSESYENLVYYKSKVRTKENGGGRGGHQSGATVPVKQVKQVMVTLAVFHLCPTSRVLARTLTPEAYHKKIIEKDLFRDFFCNDYFKRKESVVNSFWEIFFWYLWQCQSFWSQSHLKGRLQGRLQPVRSTVTPWGR
jgi:hypothetical protein